MRRRWHLWVMVLILLVAFGMRLHRLDELPPGLFHDEAYNTLDARALVEGRPHPRFYDSWEVYSRTIHTDWPPAKTRFPVFLEGNYGREPLFHYLGALAIALVGPKVWALRLVAASMGTLTVPTVYLITREMFADDSEKAKRLAISSAAVATGVYSMLAFSRLGLRIITLVTLEGLTVALWWRAGRRGQARRWALAGSVMGLTQYTYIPARLLPLLVLPPTLVWIKRRPQQRAQLIQGATLALLVALLVTAPLLVFFVRYPAYLTLRAKAIAADAPERGLSMMAANVGRVLLGLTWRGDPNPLLNLPGRPALDAAQALFFAIGAATCLFRARRSAYAFLLLWAVGMHLPSIVSGVAPTFGRSIGGTLPVAVIVAVGMETTWKAVVALWPRRHVWATLGLFVALVLSAGLTARDYFFVWAKWPQLAQMFHEEMATVGRYIGRLSPRTVVYMTPTQKYYATLLQAMQHPGLAGEGKRDRPRDFYGPAGLLPAGDPDREAAYLVLEGDETTADRLETAFPYGRWDARRESFSAYRVPPTDERAHPEYPSQAEFAGLIQLLGSDALIADVRPGDTLLVQLAWQALAPMAQRYTAFVHLLGPHNPATGSPLWAQDDHEPGYATYATDRWFPREVVMDTFTLQIPTDTPTGTYALSTGFYDRETKKRLPRSDAEGDTATMITVTIEP